MIKKEKHKGKRTIGASLIVAAAVLLGAWLQSANSGNMVLIWLTTAVYMLGPLLASLIVWSRAVTDRWLYVTAVLLSLAIVVPWAVIAPSAWAVSFLPQLGHWSNVLFIVLLVSQVSAERPPRGFSWALTVFYLLILVGIPFLL